MPGNYDDDDDDAWFDVYEYAADERQDEPEPEPEAHQFTGAASAGLADYLKDAETLRRFMEEFERYQVGRRVKARPSPVSWLALTDELLRCNTLHEARALLSQEYVPSLPEPEPKPEPPTKKGLSIHGFFHRTSRT